MIRPVMAIRLGTLTLMLAAAPLHAEGPASGDMKGRHQEMEARQEQMKKEMRQMEDKQRDEQRAMEDRHQGERKSMREKHMKEREDLRQKMMPK